MALEVVCAHLFHISFCLYGSTGHTDTHTHTRSLACDLKIVCCFIYFQSLVALGVVCAATCVLVRLSVRRYDVTANGCRCSSHDGPHYFHAYVVLGVYIVIARSGIPLALYLFVTINTSCH